MSGRFDLQIEQGATYTLPVTYKNSDGTAFNLTGWTLRGQIRKHVKSEDVIASFTFNIISELNGQFEAVLPAAVSAAIEAGETSTDPRSIYCYDIEIEYESANSGAIVINTDSVGATFTRLTGSFVTEGFIAGQIVTTSGFTNSGNNTAKVILTVVALIITVTDATGLVTETGSGDERVESVVVRRVLEGKIYVSPEVTREEV